MAQNVVVKQVCPQCGGDGLYGAVSGPQGSGAKTCNWTGCEGTGYIELGFVTLDPGLEDVINKLNDVLNKCDDILEKLEE